VGSIAVVDTSSKETAHSEKKKTILVVDDDQIIHKIIHRLLGEGAYEVISTFSGKEALDTLMARDVDVALVDIRMPGMSGMEVLREVREKDLATEVIMITAYATIEEAVQAIKIGAYNFLSKPFDNVNRIYVEIQNALDKKELKERNVKLEQELVGSARFRHLVGSTPAMLRIFDLMERLSQSDTTVLIQGESGTGKEIIARGIHLRSQRKKSKFIPVNCGALPEAIIESEFFGHEKGSFTGAVASTLGLFRVADGGTLFLDEVGELPKNVQVKLLRVIQEGEIRPVGSTKTFKVDVRILAATNHDLEQQVQRGTFREDLYYRLNVVRIQVPPLRERKEDIPLLIAYFMERFNLTRRRLEGIDDEALRLLMSYLWPGNVRELENCLEQCYALGRGPGISAHDLPPEIRDLAVRSRRPLSEGLESSPRSDSLPPLSGEYETESPPLSFKDYERLAIRRAMEQCGGDIERAAKILGVGQSTLYRKLRTHRFRASEFSQK
jgi:DNA-binding NtrC family response regulator